MRLSTPRILSAFAVAVSLAATLTVSMQAQEARCGTDANGAPVQWCTNDIFVGVGTVINDAAVNPGTYRQLDPTGTLLLNKTLVDAVASGLISRPASYTNGCAQDPTTGDLMTTGLDTNILTRFAYNTYSVKSWIDASAHTSIPANCNTPDPNNAVDCGGVESVIFDKVGNYYVGTVHGTNQILKYDRNDIFVHAYTVPLGKTGPEWLELAVDQNTMFYTSEDGLIRVFRLDGSPLDDLYAKGVEHLAADPTNNHFGQIPIRLTKDGAPTEAAAFQVRVLPPGDGSGGLLVATVAGVYWIGLDGRWRQGFAAPNMSFWFSLDVTADGQYFWTATLPQEARGSGPSRLFKYYIPTGELIVDTGNNPDPNLASVLGVCAIQEYTAGATQPDCTANPSHPLCTPGGLVNCVETPNASVCHVQLTAVQAPWTIPDQDNFEGDVVTPVSVAATPAAGRTLTYQVMASSGGLMAGPGVPAGMGLTFDPVTKMISGQIDWNAGKSSVYHVRVIATTVGSPTLTSSTEFLWTVRDKSGPPTITGATINGATVPIPGSLPLTVSAPHGTSTTVTLTATDPDQCDHLTFSSPDAPSPGGPTITSSTNPSSCPFSAPFIGTISWAPLVDGTTTFTVVAADGHGNTAPVTIAWTATNSAPSIVSTIGNQSTHVGAAVNTPALVATDPEGDTLTFSVNGTLPPGILFDSATGKFSGAPTQVGSFPNLSVTVSDGHGGAASTPAFKWDVTNTAPTFPTPIPAVFALVNAAVNTNVAKATDADGDALKYTATGLPPGFAVSPQGVLTGSSATTLTATVTLHAFDGYATATTTFALTVSTNRLPDCTTAVASPASVWPPNHKFVPIGIDGVTDPDGDPIKLTITRILQDEPTVSTGDDKDDDHEDDEDRKHAGRADVDGIGVNTSRALVRAERMGDGDGRVYEIRFLAEDNKGGSCSGSVLVSVPHDKGKKGAAVDSKIRYDSTVAGGPPLTGPEFNLAPAYVNPGHRRSKAGHALTLTTKASDPNLDALIYSDVVGAAHTLPTGLLINATTGTITGTPTVAGTYPVTLTVSDPYGGTATVAFTWTIVPD